MDRMTRGFHRIGLTLAAPFIFVSLYCLGAAVLAGAEHHETPTILLFALSAALGGAMIYGICRAIAWIVNGFRETTPAMPDSN